MVPGSARFPWRREWQPTAVFLPAQPHGQRSLAGCSPWGRRESDRTEQLGTSPPLLCKVVLVPPAPQSDSPPPWVSFPFRSPQSIEQSSQCSIVGSQQSSVSYIVLYISQSQSPIHPTLPILPWCLYICSLHLFKILMQKSSPRY